MMKTKLYDRTIAFLIHLSISFAIFVVVASFILMVWYPGIFLHFGGKKALFLIASVDLILGPVLTFIVFDKAKKSLKWDLTLIGLVQATALSYGLYSVYGGRPILQILSYDGVHIVSRSEILSYGLDIHKMIADHDSLPIKAFLDLPNNLQDIETVREATKMIEGIPLHLRQDLFRSFPADSQLAYLQNNEDGVLHTPIASNIKTAQGIISLSTGALTLEEVID